MLKAIQKALSLILFFLPENMVRAIGFETFSYFGRSTTKTLRTRVGKNYVNLGCGPNLVTGWINVDFFAVKGVDYAADLRFPLKITSETVDGIFTEHTLEHLAYPDADRLLGECYRIMKKETAIRIVVPDVSLFITNYSSNNTSWFEKWEELYFRNSKSEERSKRKLNTPLEALSFVTQEYGHQSSWDFQTLSHYLRKNGFTEITRCDFMKGTHPPLLIDQDEEDRKFISIYIEARKA